MGVVGGIIAQGLTLLVRGVVIAVWGVTAPASVTMAAFAFTVFLLGLG
ncbi:hypothetical protein [Aliivibrio fischeri]